MRLIVFRDMPTYNKCFTKVIGNITGVPFYKKEQMLGRSIKWIFADRYDPVQLSGLYITDVLWVGFSNYYDVPDEMHSPMTWAKDTFCDLNIVKP